MRIVLDTASLIAALRSRHGAAAEVFRLIFKDELVLLMDLKLSLEYRDVALRPDHLAASGRSSQNVIELLNLLDDIAEPVFSGTSLRPLSPDPDDDMVLELAIHGAADVIVTTNVKHFASAGKQFGIAVLQPSDFLEWRSRDTGNRREPPPQPIVSK